MEFIGGLLGIEASWFHRGGHVRFFTESYCERRKVQRWKKRKRSEDDRWGRRIALERKLPGGG